MQPRGSHSLLPARLYEAFLSIFQEKNPLHRSPVSNYSRRRQESQEPEL